MTGDPNPSGAGTPAAHWGTAHPEDQPPRDLVLSLARIVTEARDRLGPAATPDRILEDLAARGIDADPAAVRRLCGDPHC